MPGFLINNGGGDNSLPNSTIETARAHRWKFFLTGETYDIVMYALSVQRPTVEIDTINMFHKQNQIRMPGKYRWLPINVKFYEIVDGIDLTASRIFSYWSGSSRGSAVVFSKNTINSEFRATATITMEDGSGTSVWKYKLYNVWPSKVEPSELNYAQTELSTVQVTLNYDSADENNS